MQQHTLSGQWRLRQAGTDTWYAATVPGGVHTDLLAAGAIPDPFVGDNELQVQWVPEQDWEYRRTFTVAPALLADQRVELVCDGLDTLAEVWLNGQALGQTNNQFRAYRWNVAGLLRPGENEIAILFRSAIQYIDACADARVLPGVGEWIQNGQYIRKTPSHFGWDWGPHVPAVGIWQDIRLEGRNIARLDDIHLRQQHAGGQVALTAAVTAEAWADAPLTARLTVTAPDGQVWQTEAELAQPGQPLSVVIEQPQLWWPNGYGAQPLYRAEVALRSGDTELDRRPYQVGLRTVELRQEDDAWGRSFVFVVNGVPVFSKGANWIPGDSFPTRLSPQMREHLIASAAATHQNMLRVWGGGYYEDEHLYDLCDRYGLLVWQDFMFACSVYPLGDEAFLDNLRVEVREQVRRLRHRACMALWCGNNELEQGWVYWGWSRPDTEDLKAAYVQFFHRLLPEWVAADDPDAAYWPSSPTSNTPFEGTNADERGDTHIWEVWHAVKPFAYYRTRFSRFISEFGFQSLPVLATVASYAQPADWNMTSYIMEHHQRHGGGNGKIITYLTEHFQIPKDFAALVYASQLLQAEAMRVGIEHWRRAWPRTAGTLYWQLNDCWPVASWSSIDYYGRWKAMHYAARRFFAPLLLSVEDNGPRLGLYISNDARAPWQGELRWSLERLRGEQVDAGRAPVEAAPHVSAQVLDLDLTAQVTPANRRELVLVAELWSGDQRLSLAVTPFVPSKHLSLEAPGIAAELELEGGLLVVRLAAQSLARFVELALQGADVIFSDNYFDLPAGRSVSVTCPLPDGWTVETARQALRIRSLFDTYATEPV